VNYAFNRMFTLAEIAERAALPIERLRYVIDSRILPGRRHLKPGAGASSPGRGIPRAFTDDEAFGLVVVVLMLQGGIRRRVVQDCTDLLAASVVPNSRRIRDVLWTRVVLDEAIVALEIGDGLNVRLVFQGVPLRMNSELPRTWIRPPKGATVENYDPLLVVRINLAKIRKHFRSRSSQLR
jgi:hypothetical protein